MANLFGRQCLRRDESEREDALCYSHDVAAVDATLGADFRTVTPVRSIRTSGAAAGVRHSWATTTPSVTSSGERIGARVVDGGIRDVDVAGCRVTDRCVEVDGGV